MSGQGQFADLVNATLSGFIGDAAIDVAVQLWNSSARHRLSRSARGGSGGIA